MSQLAQALASGVLVGLAYAVLGVGFSLTWGATGVINAAHGILAVIGAYVGYYANELLGVDPLLGVLVTTPVFFGLGVLFHAGLVRPLKHRVGHNAAMASVVLTFGVAIALENIVALAFTADPRLTKTGYVLSTVRAGPVAVPGGAVVAAGVALVVLAAVAWFLYRTYTGRAVRAVEQQPEGAVLSGIDVRRVNAVTYGIAFATAAMAGAALSLVYAFSPGTQLDWLVVTFLVVILGGVGSILGVTVAGLLAGLILTLSTLFVPFAWTNLVLFVALVLTLLVRPSGLFAR